MSTVRTLTVPRNSRVLSLPQSSRSQTIPAVSRSASVLTAYVGTRNRTIYLAALPSVTTGQGNLG